MLLSSLDSSGSFDSFESPDGTHSHRRHPMKLPHVLRSLFAVALLLAAAFLASGCSKSPAKPKPPAPPPHADVDDIAQMIATTFSADNGGWYFLVKTLADSLAPPAPNLATGRISPYWAVPMSSRIGVRNNWSATKAGITYNVVVGYWRADTLGTVTSTRDTASDHLEANVVVSGGVFANANGLNGDYGYYHADPDAPSDSSFAVFNLQTTAPDTLVFSGSADDSCFANIVSTITPNPPGRLWYHQNFFDFELHLLKSTLLTNPYPVEGSVDWVVEAYPLGSPRRFQFGRVHGRQAGVRRLARRDIVDLR